MPILGISAGVSWSHIRALAASIFVLMLAGCGVATAGAATTASTPTCPPAPQFATVSGKITALTSGSVTVTTTDGNRTQVILSASTRITHLAPAQTSALTAGTPIQVVTDTNATKALSIRILSASGTGAGAGFGSQGPPRATPATGFNRACLRQSGQGQSQGQGASQRGAFQGIRGTVDSATSTHLEFDDTQGQTFSVAITRATMLEMITSARPTDIQVGQAVIATGTRSSVGIAARTILIQAAE